jgi:hypothetical protein
MSSQENEEINELSEKEISLEKVASGQKFIIYAILGNFLTMFIQAYFGDIAIIVALIVLIVGITGVVKLVSGFGSHIAIKVLLVICMFIPLINLITLLILSTRATKALKAGGYNVGLLGASQ